MVADESDMPARAAGYGRNIEEEKKSEVGEKCDISLASGHSAVEEK